MQPKREGAKRFLHRGPSRFAPGDFDYYLLSLSVTPSFCDTNPHAAIQKKECLNGATADYQANPVTVHGLPDHT